MTSGVKNFPFVLSAAVCFSLATSSNSSLARFSGNGVSTFKFGFGLSVPDSSAFLSGPASILGNGLPSVFAVPVKFGAFFIFASVIVLLLLVEVIRTFCFFCAFDGAESLTILDKGISSSFDLFNRAKGVSCEFSSLTMETDVFFFFFLLSILKDI